MELLKIRETDLTSAMQKIVCTYTEQLVPVAVDIMFEPSLRFVSTIIFILIFKGYFIDS